MEEHIPWAVSILGSSEWLHVFPPERGMEAVEGSCQLCWGLQPVQDHVRHVGLHGGHGITVIPR